ncbi:Golgin candidate [Thalictrum thalictroides]|uniref:Golgin candidate n=1 Tax=Thalictrum thalictroides TaxID=46969 RepID=A0A7J6VAB8_THATH|nr:Golgin candidate [Thalictrum thalictroides]
MAWLGKVSLGNFSDLAGAVNKLSESVKNIEKNFDSALGFEEKSGSGDHEGTASGMWPSSVDRKALFDPVMSFMGHRSGESAVETSEIAESSDRSTSVKEQERISTDNELPPASEQTSTAENEEEATEIKEEAAQQEEGTSDVVGEVRSHEEAGIAGVVSHAVPVESNDPTPEVVEANDSLNSLRKMKNSEERSDLESQSADSKSSTDAVEQDEQVQGDSILETNVSDSHVGQDEQRAEAAAIEERSTLEVEVPKDGHVGTVAETSISNSTDIVNDIVPEVSNSHFPSAIHSDQRAHMSSKSVSHDNDLSTDTVEASLQTIDAETDTRDQRLNSGTIVSGSADYAVEVEKVKREMKLMEASLQGAARQAQAKADEIAKLMNENEQLKAVVEDLKRKSNEAEVEVLREEYHQRVATLERKVYALTKERDTLRREQNKKSDAAALLKEKDEIINQVMAEGEELSKKQAVQESQIRKLRAQIREFEEEKKGLTTKLQAEENKVESIKRDKTATEKFLQETIEKHQAELAAQKEHYSNALNAAKEAEALAEARANSEARTELESRLKEAGEREATLVQTLEELRQTLTRTEQQAVFREDMLRRDIDDLQKRYQASERRCEELITQVPESTRPLLRQIEAMQETTARRAEAWAGVERTLNSRLQEAEGKAATAEENERAMNERLSQTLSRVAVLEAQVSCLRSEQTQLTRSLEKERQRASENRQEYLAAQEAVATSEVRLNQLEGEMKELRRKHKQELQELMAHNELLQQEVEREKNSRLDLERTVHVETSSVADPLTKQMQPSIENGNISRKLSSSGSISSMEESYFLQASLDSSDSLSERRYLGEATMTPYYLKSMTPNAFEATLRQKEGELASYMSRLASLESIRDSLAEELVKMTAECEKLRAEAAVVPGMRAELEALRRRHSAALELMGERDEELEELRADIVDLKEMYREQVNLLVNKIQIMSSSVVA